jgi:hypothetical protein
MPLVSILLPGQQSYVEWKAVIHGKEIPYGLFLGEVVNFLLIAVVLFLFIVKFLGWLMRTRHEEATTPPPPHEGGSAPHRDSGSLKRGGAQDRGAPWITPSSVGLGGPPHVDGQMILRVPHDRDRLCLNPRLHQAGIGSE